MHETLHPDTETPGDARGEGSASPRGSLKDDDFKDDVQYVVSTHDDRGLCAFPKFPLDEEDKGDAAWPSPSPRASFAIDLLLPVLRLEALLDLGVIWTLADADADADTDSDSSDASTVTPDVFAAIELSLP